MSWIFYIGSYIVWYIVSELMYMFSCAIFRDRKLFQDKRTCWHRKERLTVEHCSECVNYFNSNSLDSITLIPFFRELFSICFINLVLMKLIGGKILTSLDFVFKNAESLFSMIWNRSSLSFDSINSKVYDTSKNIQIRMDRIRSKEVKKEAGLLSLSKEEAGSLSISNQEIGSLSISTTNRIEDR